MIHNEKYQSAKKQLVDTLRVIDVSVDGESRPQNLKAALGWVELNHSPGVFVKNITLFRPNNFAIMLVHGTKGSQEVKHRIVDTIEVHCITGKMKMNGLEFKAGDRIKIPQNTEYNFEFLEDTYLTTMFIPSSNPSKNFINGQDLFRPYQASTSEA